VAQNSQLLLEREQPGTQKRSLSHHFVHSLFNTQPSLTVTSVLHSASLLPGSARSGSVEVKELGMWQSCDSFTKTHSLSPECPASLRLLTSAVVRCGPGTSLARESQAKRIHTTSQS
jgi:hypothetical protein